MSSPSRPPMCSFGTYVKLCLLVSQGKLKGMTKFKELTDDYSVLLFVAVVAQSLSDVPTPTPWTAAFLYSPLTVSWSLLKFMSIELVMLSSHLILCHSLLLLLSILPSIRVYSSELALHIRWPKH